MNECGWYAHVRNLHTGELFRKSFPSPFLLERFLKKARYSKRIKVTYHNHPDYKG